MSIGKGTHGPTARPSAQWYTRESNGFWLSHTQQSRELIWHSVWATRAQQSCVAKHGPWIWEKEDQDRELGDESENDVVCDKLTSHYAQYGLKDPVGYFDS